MRRGERQSGQRPPAGAGRRRPQSRQKPGRVEASSIGMAAAAKGWTGCRLSWPVSGGVAYPAGRSKIVNTTLNDLFTNVQLCISWVKFAPDAAESYRAG